MANLRVLLKKIDWRYGLLTLFLFLGAAIAYFFWLSILQLITAFFAIKNLELFAGTIATIFTLTHKIKTRQLKFSPTMSFNEFRVPFEDLLSFIGNPITLVCAISLAKGLFLQTSGGDKYFPQFETWELGFIGLVTAYLFFISLMELLRNIKETLTINSVGKEQVTAVAESEIKTEIPKPLNQNSR